MSNFNFSERRAVSIPGHAAAPSGVSDLYRRDPPVSRETLAEWQRQLNQAVPPTDKLSHLLIRWEPGDEWMPIQRWFLWQVIDPAHHPIEPWILQELKGPAPRSTGHPCFVGYCACDVKKNRWVGGACRYIDQATWDLYQERFLCGNRWWVIQGDKGGHRKRWEVGGLESTVSKMKGHGEQPPLPGDLPYAPFDSRVIEAVMKERDNFAFIRAIVSGAERKALLTAEEEAERQAMQKVLFERVSDQVDAMWDEGVDLLPRYFEEEYGRVPTGTRQTIDPERVDEQFLTGE